MCHKPNELKVNVMRLVRVAAVLLVLSGVAAAAELPTAMWIWHPEEQAEKLSAGAVTRYFRTTLELRAAPVAASLMMTADDEFTLYVNGKEVGSGTVWMELHRFNLAPYLTAGQNVIAVKATNTQSGPAGLIGWGKATLPSGETVPLATGKAWRVWTEGPQGWQTAGFDDAAWEQASELTGIKGGPWGGRMALVNMPAVDNAFTVQGTLREPELLPRPQQVQLQSGALPVVKAGKLVLEVAAAPELADGFAIEQLQKALRIMTGQPELQVQAVRPETPAKQPRLTLAQTPASAAVKALCAKAGVNPAQLKPQGYVLGFVGGASPQAVILGADLPGVIYGSSTFIQLMRKDGDDISARQARIADWPATPLRGARSVGISDNVVDWSAFYKMNAAVTGFDWQKPMAESLGTLNEKMARRGVKLLTECHMGGERVPFIYTNPAHRQAMLDRVNEAIALGLPALNIMVDDEPNAPQSPEDEAKYGKGLVGLGKAQMEMMAEVAKAAEGKIEIIFCPRVYYDPYQKGVYPTQPTADEAEYTRLVGTLPPNIDLWTTQPKPSYIAELNKTWGRKPYIYHNVFYSSLADTKLFFLAYPVPTTELLKGVSGFTGSGSGQRYLREWRVNYLGLAGNTWNPGQPVGLKEAFVREYGEQAAPFLLEYASALGSELKPGVPLMADVWDQPDAWPGVGISLGFAGRLGRLEPNEANVQKMMALAAAAKKATEIAWDKSGLEDSQIEVLQLNARRIYLNYATLADLLSVEHGMTLKIVADYRPTVDRATEQAKEIRSIIEALMLNPEVCGDWNLLDRAERLATQVK